MKLLRQPAVAFLLMLVMIVGAAIGGSYRSLSRLAHQTERIFYEGTEGDGLSIQGDLEERIALSYNLTVIAQKYSGTEDVVQETLKARENLVKAETPKEKYQANLRLTETTTLLYNALGELELSENDEKYRVRIFTDLTSRNDTISHDGYNPAAAEFNQKLTQFPANVLSRLCGISPLSLFQ